MEMRLTQWDVEALNDLTADPDVAAAGFSEFNDTANWLRRIAEDN